MSTQERKALELALEGGSLYEITGRIEDIDKCIVHRSVIKEALAQRTWVNATTWRGLTDEMLALLKRYRKETPLGNQPHMIAHLADEIIEKYEAAHGIKGD